MLYALLDALRDLDPDLQIVRYITVRTALAAVFAFLFAALAGGPMIRLLRRLGIREDTARSDSKTLNELHASKKHTPTMGGVIYLSAIFSAVGLCGRLDNAYVILVLLVTASLGAVGARP